MKIQLKKYYDVVAPANINKDVSYLGISPVNYLAPKLPLDMVFLAPIG